MSDIVSYNSPDGAADGATGGREADGGVATAGSTSSETIATTTTSDINVVSSLDHKVGTLPHAPVYDSDSTHMRHNRRKQSLPQHLCLLRLTLNLGL